MSDLKSEAKEGKTMILGKKNSNILKHKGIGRKNCKQIHNNVIATNMI